MAKLTRTIGSVVDACVLRTTEEWLRQHSGYRSREEALAEDVKTITTSTELHPGGRLLVQVGVVARRRSQEQLDFYAFERRGSRGYVQTARSAA